MRNLKKFLALVLAMVMAMSLMITANAATKSDKFPKDTDIDEHFVEAVDVLAGLKVFQGQNETGAEGGEVKFNPKASITRKEVAALMYRVFSTDVTDARAHLYKDYGNFTDVSSDAWYAGYVGLCANQEIIKGSNNGRFYPDENVTGYQVLAMILRMVGYDQNHEFEGQDWQIRVAGYATNLHITDNFNASNYDRTLNQPATREVVAELIFQTMVRVPMVTYNTLGYNDKTNLTSDIFNPNLGWEKFGLRHDWTWSAIDRWGNPGYEWYTINNHTDIETPGYVWGNEPRPATGTTTVATIKAEYTQYYNKANVRECDVSHDLGIETDETFILYVNSEDPVTRNYKLVATDTVTRVGGQGRETKFYYGITSPFAGDLAPWCTMVDTFLAKVTRVTPVVLDHNDHVVQQARADLEVFDRADAVGTANRATQNVGTAVNFINDDDYGTRCTNLTKGPDSSAHYITQNTNFTYAVGDYLLIRGYTDQTQDWDNNGSKTAMEAVGGGYVPGDYTGLYHFGSEEAIEKMAFETNMLFSDHDDADIVVEKPAPTPAVLGKQSTVTWNEGTHVVGGETKDDQLTLFMDYAGRKLDTTFAWYYDQFGNIIGIGPVPNDVNYGIITSLYSAFDQGTNATTGTTKAMAKVTYADGSTGTVAIDKFYMSGDLNGNVGIAAMGYNTTGNGTNGNMEYANNNAVVLTPLYDYNTGKTVMTAVPGTADDYTSNGGSLLVAPVASINKAADSYVPAATTLNNGGHFGIINYNMFKFVTTEDGVVTAIEVAGGKPASATQGNGNSPLYAGHYNLRTAAVAGAGKLNKTQGNIVIGNGFNAYDGGSPDAKAIWLDKDVKIILNTDGDVKTYTLSTLLSDVTIDADSEIDWADVNGDLRADYVYLYGETTGTVTYGMFYYNGGPASWNGTEGTLSGWLNGEDATVKFTDEDEFKAVQNSQGYRGHLFALRFMDGIVDDVMIAKNYESGAYSTAAGAYLLYDEPNAYPGSGETGNVSGTTLKAGWNTLGGGPAVSDNTVYKSGTTTVFGLGSVNAAYGNKYSETTEAIYLKDTGATVTYHRADGSNRNQFFGTVTGGGVTYYVTDTSIIRGIGMGVTHGEAVLYYLERAVSNDVTIIYDSTTMAILEIYVATDPDVTPSGNGWTVTKGTVTLTTTQIQMTGKAQKDGADKSTECVVTAVIESFNSASGWLQLDSITWTPAADGSFDANHALGYTLGNGMYRITVTVTDGANNTHTICTQQIVTFP